MAPPCVRQPGPFLHSRVEEGPSGAEVCRQQPPGWRMALLASPYPPWPSHAYCPHRPGRHRSILGTDRPPTWPPSHPHSCAHSYSRRLLPVFLPPACMDSPFCSEISPAFHTPAPLAGFKTLGNLPALVSPFFLTCSSTGLGFVSTRACVHTHCTYFLYSASYT